MKFENVLKLIQTVSDSSLTEFELEKEEIRISMRVGREAQTVVLKKPASLEEDPPTDVLEEAKGVLVTSPLVGTFYGAPSEDAACFVKVGDKVRKGQVLAIVEAMKLMNEIESETEGTVTGIFVTSGEMVEYGQPLFQIES